MSDANSRSPGATSTTASSTGSGSDRLHGEDIKREAAQTTEEVQDAARQQARGLFDRQKDAAAEQADKLSTVLRKTAKEFDEQQQPYFSQCVSDLASRTGTLSQRLRDRDLDSLMDQARDYSRRQPAMFVGGAVLAGFMLSRFLRSSSENQPPRR